MSSASLARGGLARWLLLVVVVSVLGVGAPGAHAAAPGDPDPSFNGSGLVTAPAGTQFFAVAVQASGEVVAAGQAGGSVIAQRFTPGGAAVGPRYTGPSGFAKGVAIQPDGKVVLAGFSNGGMFAERLSSTLTPDPSFGSGAIATAFGGLGGVARGVAIGPDGSIVIAGSVFGNDTQAAVAKFTPRGAADPTFNSTGSKIYNFDHGSSANAVAVQSDGKIVVVGQQTPLQLTNGVVARINGDGSLDPTFKNPGGTGAFTFHQPDGGYTALNAVTLQNDGRIVIAGVDVGGPNALFLRLMPDGRFDTTFGGSGVAVMPSAQASGVNPGAALGANGVGVAGGGRIVGAGVYAHGGTLVDAATWALTPSGVPSTDYANAGTNIFPTSNREACGMAVAPDGRIVIVGDTVTSYPDNAPCTVNGAAGAFVARLVGFGPPPAHGSAPSVTTGAAGGLGPHSATLTGQIDPHGSATTFSFQYGATAAYGSATPPGTLSGSAAGAQGVSAGLSGLQPNTVYHYRLVASNGAGGAVGADRTFRTAGPVGPPVLSTGSAKRLGEVSAFLTGQLDAGGQNTSYHFDFGEKKSYGRRSAVAISTSSGRVGVTISGLRPHTRYHFRLVASNASGTRTGKDATFTTLPRLRLRIAALPLRYSARTLAASGIMVGLNCSQTCEIHASLVISATRQNRYLTHGRPYRVAAGSGTARSGRRLVILLRLSPAGQSAVTALGPRQLTLVVSARPATGGPVATSARAFTLTP